MQHFSLPHLADYDGNTVASKNDGAFSVKTEQDFLLGNRYGNFWFRMEPFSAVARAHLCKYKSALCKCKNSVIILFSRAPWYSLSSRSDKYFCELRRVWQKHRLVILAKMVRHMCAFRMCVCTWKCGWNFKKWKITPVTLLNPLMFPAHCPDPWKYPMHQQETA